MTDAVESTHPFKSFRFIFPPPFFITTTSVDFNLLFFPLENEYFRKRGRISYMTSILRRIIDAKKRSIVVKIRLPLSLRFIVNFLSSYVFALYSSISEDETRDIGLLKYDSDTGDDEIDPFLFIGPPSSK